METAGNLFVVAALSAAFHAVRDFRKLMDFFVWLRVNHSDALSPREDLQQHQAEKEAALCSV